MYVYWSSYMRRAYNAAKPEVEASTCVPIQVGKLVLTHGQCNNFFAHHEDEGIFGEAAAIISFDFL